MTTPTSPPTKAGVEKAGQRIRVQLLNILTIVIALVAAPVALPNASVAYKTNHPALAIIYIAAIVISILNATVRKFPYSYQIRTWGILTLLYGLGFIAYTNSGLHGDARIWLFTATTISALLLPPLHIAINMIIALALHFGSGFLLTHHFIAYKSPIGIPLQPYGTWVRDGITLAAVMITINTAIWFLIKSIEKALEESQSLSNALEHERIRLEQQSALLQKRLEQINTASEITRALNTILDPDELMNEVVNLVQKRFNLYYAGVFLLDERGEYAVLQAGTGEAGRRMLAEGHRLAVGGSSMIGWAISNRKPRIALDVGEEAVRFANPHLPLTRTELALPLISRGEVLGAMTIQSERPRAFDEDDLKVLQSIADNLATALHNAFLFQQTQRTIEEIAAERRRILGEIWENVSDTLEASITTPEAKSGNHLHQLRVPIKIYGSEMGEVVLEKAEPWGEDEKEMAQQAVYQVALALENLQLIEETRRAAQVEQMVSQITGEIAATLDVDEMLRRAIRRLQSTLGLTQAEIVLTTPQGE